MRPLLTACWQLFDLSDAERGVRVWTAGLVGYNQAVLMSVSELEMLDPVK